MLLVSQKQKMSMVLDFAIDDDHNAPIWRVKGYETIDEESKSTYPES